MSLHAQLTPEAEAKLAAQKRNSTITAVIIALLCLVLIGVILMTIALITQNKETPALVSYSSTVENDEEVKKPEIRNQVQRKPSSSSSSATRVIAANVQSPLAVPVPEIQPETPSVEFGDGDDFGDGWGDGWGDGNGSGGGAVGFFGSTAKAERVAYVIDYSLSMRGQKIELLKKELVKSVGELQVGTEYQLIFFAGPAWIAGDNVKGSKKKATVTHKGYRGKTEVFNWTGTSFCDWKVVGDKQKATWIKATDKKLKESLEAINETPLVYGTAWEKPIKMAMNMDPLPDMIIFLTDGSAGSRSPAIAREMGDLAKEKGVRVNTVALMEPKARKPMADLARRSGGEFTLVDDQGKVHKQDLNDPKNK